MPKPNQAPSPTAEQRDAYHGFNFAVFGTPIPKPAAIDLIQNPDMLAEEINLASTTIEAASTPEIGRTVPEITEGADERLGKLVSLLATCREKGYGETDFGGHTVSETNGGSHSVHIRSDELGRRRLKASR